MTDDPARPPTIAFVTPSYSGDFERCRLLCESTSLFLPAGIEHVLIVDRRDVPLFRQLESRTVRVVEGERLLPWWIFRPPGVSRWWASLASPPIRNWVYQQLLKIAAVRATDADILHFVDSDVALIRPFDPGFLLRDGLVRLQLTDYDGPEHGKWKGVAQKLLGAPGGAIPPGNYVGNFITWRRANVLAMLERIAQVNRSSWERAIARQLRFSEYMTYGVFVDTILGARAAGHFHDDRPNLALCWKYDVHTPAGMAAFFAELPPGAMGIMMHSKYDLPVSAYRPRVEALWAAAR